MEPPLVGRLLARVDLVKRADAIADRIGVDRTHMRGEVVRKPRSGNSLTVLEVIAIV